MPHIQQLSPHVADLIAAGEVVERPASVVKELTENAIDAGASALVVEIQAGGMGLIRVTDNGCGIAPEEMPVAFLRHATSKLRSAQDLGAIGTLGFRGEALAAISAVSRVELLSRQTGAEAGASLRLEGGVPDQVTPAGCPEGTTILVRDLFYNTPARQKFMKSDSAEAAAVAALVQQLALSRPEVSIRYIRDGKEELHTPGDGKLLSAVYAARGRDFALGLTEVDGGGEGISVRGYVTQPLAGRGSRSMQTFFCCGRVIKSPLLTAALEEAYANRQMKGKFPGCVLHIDLPLHMVDVNVHPAKTVVKFVNERAVFSAVHHAVKAALDGHAVPEPELRPAAVTNPRQNFYQTMDARTFRERQGAQPSNPPRRETPPVQHPAPVRPAFDPSELGGRSLLRDSVQPGFDALRRRREAAEKRPAPPAAEPVPATARASIPAEPVQETMAPAAVPWRYAGEVLDTYIIAQDGDDVYLIDKHAAHERINFDRMRAGQEPVMRQTLLAPLAVDLSREQYAALLEQLPLLEDFGFEAEDFGQGCLMVRAIPSDLGTGQVRETLEELADKLLTGAAADPASARDAMLHTMACKASIMGAGSRTPPSLRSSSARSRAGRSSTAPTAVR